MDNGIDRYLHKKFKKLLSASSAAAANSTAVENNAVPTINSTNATAISSPPLQHQQQEAAKSSSISTTVVTMDNNNISSDDISNSTIVVNNLSSISSVAVNSADEDIFLTDQDKEKEQIKVSSSGGKYVCTYCNLACSKPSVLQKHIRAHTNERPFPCVSCGFSFKTRSNLYKHCRSRSHANRVMGNTKAQELRKDAPLDEESSNKSTPEPATIEQPIDDLISKSKPYKPRFHTTKTFYDENTEFETPTTSPEPIHPVNNNNNINKLPAVTSVVHDDSSGDVVYVKEHDEPLNLTSKSRKRCMSEVSEPTVQKSLIKELLLKNLYADMRCPHCKMIFQTVTDLETHKMGSCKGMTKTGARYSRSSSVNVASILTQNKNAFDNIPHLQNTVFPLKSPGPFLGKTRLVDSDKNKSFSFENCAETPSFFPSRNDLLKTTQRYSLSIPSAKAPVKLFGGEVKISQDSSVNKFVRGDVDYLGGNRVVKNTLQSGGTVMQSNKGKVEVIRSSPEVIRVYDSDGGLNGERYPNIEDFSQKAVKSLAPNLKQLNLTIPGLPVPATYMDGSSPLLTVSSSPIQKTAPPINGKMLSPMNIMIDGKIVRYVPGIPGPVIPAEIPPIQPSVITTAPKSNPQQRLVKPNIMITPVSEPPPSSPVKTEPPVTTPSPPQPPKKFARPNSLALKPTITSLKQHHGLTPTMFNQILISPDTPRGAKKYNEHFLHGNYFSYLGLKSSTKPVYCTLNKTQPFYVPHFKKLSMYSEWRQQDNKSDKLYVSAYDSRQRSRRYCVSGKYEADSVVHSSYKCVSAVSPTSPSSLKDDDGSCSPKKKQSQHQAVIAVSLRKQSPVATAAATDAAEEVSYGGSSFVRVREETSTRQQEHEAAYGLLSLSQKSTNTTTHLSPIGSDSLSPSSSFINAEQLAHVSKTSYAKNKFLDQSRPNFKITPGLQPTTAVTSVTSDENIKTHMGHGYVGASLMYPYSTKLEIPEVAKETAVDRKNIIHFNVIQRYNPQPQPIVINNNVETVECKVSPPADMVPRKRKAVIEDLIAPKVARHESEAAMDLSMQTHNHNGTLTEVKEQQRFLQEPPQLLKTPQGVRFSPIDAGNCFSGWPRISYITVDEPPQVVTDVASAVSVVKPSPIPAMTELDNSAMETLADVATKQEKLEKNSAAKNLASEFLKIATKNDYHNGEVREVSNATKEMNELVAKSEENRSCVICSKNFSKPSQLKLHMNIHYIERPFRCEPCSTSFRTKGHLQKHERSASHHNKLSSSPALSSSEPRPFKCGDCSIAFRIHGHLAKHLRSKMHIMKLECLAKIPFGLYAELERSNSLLTEINTADGDQCLDSLKCLAKRIFEKDPTKLSQHLSDEHRARSNSVSGGVHHYSDNTSDS